MKLSDYLIEAVAKRSVGKYFDIENLDIMSMQYQDLVQVLGSLPIKEIPEEKAILIRSLVGIRSYSEACKELKSEYKEGDLVWMRENGCRDLWFFLVGGKSVEVWNLVWGRLGGVISCTNRLLPSGFASNTTTRTLVRDLEDVIKYESK